MIRHLSLSRDLRVVICTWRRKYQRLSITCWCQTMSIPKATPNGSSSKWKILELSPKFASISSTILSLIVSSITAWKFLSTLKKRQTRKTLAGTKGVRISAISRITSGKISRITVNASTRLPSHTTLSTIMILYTSLTLFHTPTQIWGTTWRTLRQTLDAPSTFRRKLYAKHYQVKTVRYSRSRLEKILKIFRREKVLS